MFVFRWFIIQARILKNAFKENKKAFLFRDVLHPLILLFGLACLYIFLDTMFGFIQKRGMSAFDFAFILLSFSLVVILPLVFYSAVVCSLSFLFQKEEVNFYFSLPVNRLSLFTVKLLQTYFHTNWMVFLGMFTFLMAVQNFFKTTPLIYITGSIGILIFLLIPVCLAAMLVIIVSRFFTFVKAKGVLTVIGLFVGSVLLSAIRLMQPEQLATVEGKLRLATFVQNLRKPWMTLFPSEWLTNILFSQIQHDFKGILLNLLILCIVALISVFLLYLLAAFFYEKAWADAVVAPDFSYRRFTWRNIPRIFPHFLRVFIRKDLLSFSRDTLEKGSLLILIPLSFVYLYGIYVLNRHIQNAHEEPIISFLYIYLFNLFYSSVVVCGLSGRWVFPSVSLEGNNFKLIKAAPVPLKDFLKAKFLLGFIPLLLLGETLVLSSSFILHLSLLFTLISVLVTALLCWGITLVCLILGITEADFTIGAPLDFALSTKGFICLTWEFVYVVTVIILVSIPVSLFLYRGPCPSSLLSLIVSLLIVLIIIQMLRYTYQRGVVRLSRREV